MDLSEPPRPRTSPARVDAIKATPTGYAGAIRRSSCSATIWTATMWTKRDVATRLTKPTTCFARARLPRSTSSRSRLVTATAFSTSPPSSRLRTSPMSMAPVACLVMDYGDVAMPLFEKCESLLEIARSRTSTRDRARLIATRSRTASHVSN